jgi:hypothetical protein
MRDANAGCWMLGRAPTFPSAVCRRLNGKVWHGMCVAVYGMEWHGMTAVGHRRFSGPYGQPSPSSQKQNQGLAVTCFSDPAAIRRAVHSNPEIGQREKGISRGAAVVGA